MTIKSVSSDVTRGSDAATRAQSSGPNPALQAVAGEIGGVRGIDAVSISDEGRALSAGDSVSGSEPGTIDPRRAAELRRKILSGAYDSNEVADQIARAILARGDL